MDFISFISKMTAMECEVLFLRPKKARTIEMRVYTTNTTPRWHWCVILEGEKIGDARYVAAQLSMLEHAVMKKLDELRKTPMPSP